jgi:protein-L-isoaspartate(D-aspartate) O-methyltransferase
MPASLCLAADAFQAQRMVMVQKYVAAEGIKNAQVLAAMRSTPRHEFISPENRQMAYFDMAIPIGHGQTISPPYVVAFMTEAIDPQPADRVLEIGTGSGYQAAVLSPLVQEVFTIEIVRPLGEQAAATLQRLRYDNVHTRIGDGYAGWPEEAPFDKIIVTCSPENVPPALVEQLKEGGQMVIPVGERFQQTLVRLTKVQGQLQREPLQETFFVPMTGSAEEQREILPDPEKPELVHGSFETTLQGTDQPAGWYYVREGAATADAQAPDGQHVVTFTNQTPGRSAHALQAFGVDGRRVRQLDVRCWVRGRQIRPGANRDHRAQVLVEFYADNRAAVGQANLGPWLGTFDWRLFQQRVDVPENARLAVVGIGLFGATGEIAFDQVAVQSASAP